MPSIAPSNSTGQLEIAGVQYNISRPHRFGLVIERPTHEQADDYLHQHLLTQENRATFFELIANEGLIVCRNIHSQTPSYRPVHGKSSRGKLSQAEYYHHDGCSGPTKPRLVEIRLPHQECDRQVATAIAPFPDVIQAMLKVLPARLLLDTEMSGYRESFSGSSTDFPPVETWDKIQGRVTRVVRREMDAESCRSYFRDVDRAAGAYDLPWQMGDSRLMLNDDPQLSRTLQHRRAYQKPRQSDEQNGSLVKRWTAEEV